LGSFNFIPGLDKVGDRLLEMRPGSVVECVGSTFEKRDVVEFGGTGSFRH
jgi:hypothetical protein